MNRLLALLKLWLWDASRDIADASEFPPDPPMPEAPSFFHLYLLTDTFALPLTRKPTLAEALHVKNAHVLREMTNGWQRVACDDPYGTLLVRGSQVMALTILGGADGVMAQPMAREWWTQKPSDQELPY